jgi:putative Mg2+ transporter-C (MgtC) family protein
MGFHEQSVVIGRVLLAILLGGLIGLEREWADKPAGLRTHMLICGSAALLIGLGDFVVFRLTSTAVAEHVRADPIRIIEAIITGISFLGAGTIFVRGREERLEGLTTAASILFTAGIGMSVGIGKLYLAIALTLIVLAILVVVARVERLFNPTRHRHDKPE